MSESRRARGALIERLQSKSHAVWLSTLLLVCPWSARAQEGNEELPERPVTTVSPSGVTPVAPVEESFPGVWHGEATTVPRTDDGDDVPLPIAAEYEPGLLGDTLVREAGGNPYFLGFAAGNAFPSADERIDPAFEKAYAALGSDGRPARELYGFIMFQKRFTQERFEDLQALGVRILGFHPHYAIRAAIPERAYRAVAQHPAVRWVGFAEPWQKIHPALEVSLQSGAPGDVYSVFISVSESDLGPWSESRTVGSVMEGGPGQEPAVRYDESLLPRQWMSRGWMEAALQERGIMIDEYIPDVDVFLARVTSEQIIALQAFDFVQFVELDLPAETNHDESMPLVGADQHRAAFPGNVNSITNAGLIDSGVLVSHTALNHFYWVVWDYVGTGGTTDQCGHGSHVAGTMLGLPVAADSGYKGAAPNTGWGATARFRMIKEFAPSATGCSSVGTSLSTLFAATRVNYTDSQGNVTTRNHVVNNSWGRSPCPSCSTCTPWIGSETNARITDDQVFTYNQLQVFAAGNSGSCGVSTIGLPAVAKNALTVGSIIDHRNSSVGDPGTLWTGSSEGPCGDNRWKPNIVAPGRWVRSVDATGTTGFVDFNGTSMATPHVAGGASQLMDHYTWLAGRPYTLAALLQATANTKDNVVLSTPSASHLDQYGCGRMNLQRAHYSEADWSWGAWYYSYVNSFPGLEVDFTVGTGATRLVVCMTYYEPSASAGASRALVSNLDLWVDAPPLTAGTNTGEYSAQRSTVDNTEIRHILSPTAGTWRWKVHPTTFLPGADVKIGIAVFIQYGDDSPDTVLSLGASDQYVRPNETTDITATVYPSDNLLSAAYLDTQATGGATLTAASTTLKDGAVTNQLTNQASGLDITLGDIEDDSPRSATWTARWGTEGVKAWTVQARADNDTGNQTATVNVTVDGTAPPTVGNLASTSHTVNAWSNSRILSFAWTQAADNLSGVDGYGEFWNSSNPTGVGTTRDFGASTSRTVTLTSDYDQVWYGLRTVDRSGNWSTEVAAGPYRIDTVDPANPTNLRSTSHTVGAWSTDPSIDFAWNAATDDRSGIGGYADAFETRNPPGVGVTPTLSARAVSKTENATSSANGWYYALRSIDNAGNAPRTLVQVGPYFIDSVAPSAPSNLTSTTHAVSVWSSATLARVSWAVSTDAHSGLAGYRVEWDHAAGTTPNGIINLGAAASDASTTLTSSPQGWYLHVRPRDNAGNWGPVAHFGPILIDTAGPNGPTNLASSSHTVGTWSNQASIQMTWTAATDAASGLAGYRIVNDQAANTNPAGVTNVAAGATSRTLTLSSSAAGHYVHLRAVDNAGNWGTTAHAGPYRVDLDAPTGVSLTIDAGNSETTTAAVSLAITATDVLSGVGQMRFRNDAGTFSAWQPFQGSRSWNLTSNGGSAGTGTRTVTVEVRDQAGNVTSATDTIFYYTPVSYFGNACAGQAGLPLFVIGGVPGLGRTITFSVVNTTAPLAALYLGVSNSLWQGLPLPFDMGLVGSPGCFLNVSLDAQIHSGPPAPLNVPLGNDTAIVGATVYSQYLLFGDPSGKPIVSTRGAATTISGF